MFGLLLYPQLALESPKSVRKVTKIVEICISRDSNGKYL